MRHFIILLFCITCISVSAYCQAGTLDVTFGNEGKIIQDINNSDDRILSSVLQADGKIIFVGGTSSSLLITRFDTNGKLDSAFGSNGRVITNFNFSSVTGNGVTLQNDNKIVITGSTNYSQIVTARFLENGDVDSSFGDGGKVLSNFTGYWDGESIQVQPNNKIVVVAYTSYDGQYHDNFGVVRYNSDGTLDSTFGLNGLAQPLSGDYTTAWALKISDDNKIIIGGYMPLWLDASHVQLNAFVMRLNSNGITDSTFGTSGYTEVTTNSPFYYHSSLVTDKEDRILVSVFSSNGYHGNYALIRFSGEGILDSTFGVNGLVITDITPTTEKSDAFDNPYCLALQEDGKILQAGSIKGENNVDFGLLRFNVDGILDSSFGINGIVRTPMGTDNDKINSILIQPDKKIIVSGVSNNAGISRDLAIARYNNDVIVPLKLISFNAINNGKSVLLTWQTASEINNDHFIIERSGEVNNNFKEIAKVNSKGNSNQVQQYSFEDIHSFVGKNYYRLKQIDKDGTATTSKIVLVDFIKNNIRIYPNPTSTILNIDGLNQGEKSTLTILNANGAIVAKTSIDNYSYSWNIRSFPAGTYFLRVDNGIEQTILKFIKR